MASSAGTADVEWFLASGQAGAQTIEECLARAGVKLQGLTSVLDFGCGCGRVVRHWQSLDGVSIHGCDVNRRAVAWCRRNLCFATFTECELEPPLPYPDCSFDLVYALSVVTHMPETLQIAWVAELRRLVKQGGHLLFTTHGEAYLGALTEAEQSEFRSGRLVVRRADAAGTNTCGAYHPKEYVVDHLTVGFEVIDHLPEGARGNPVQDVWLFRKVDGSGVRTEAPMHSLT